MRRKRLQLRRETVVHLDAGALRRAGGGMPIPKCSWHITGCSQYPPSEHPEECLEPDYDTLACDFTNAC